MPAPSKTYVVLADSAVAVDRPVDQYLMTVLRDNDIHHAEWIGYGYTPAQAHDHDGVNSKSVVLADGVVTTAKIGAQAVTEAKMAASAINSNALKSTYGDVSVTVAPASTGETGALPGGNFGMRTGGVWADNSSRLQFVGYGYLNGSGGLPTGQVPPHLLFYNFDSVNSEIGRGREYYIQGCPPYDLGDGEIPLFVFAEISPSGQIMRAYCAPEAPWHNNGPTNISADARRNGKEYKRVRRLREEFPNIKAARQSGLTLAQIAARLETDTVVEIEITQAIKQADMPLIPHPFMNAGPANTIVLLNPVANFTERLFRLHQEGEAVLDLLHDGNIIVDNNAVSVNAPPGVMPVAARWKLTA